MTNFSPSKRQREMDQARKKQDKADRRMAKRDRRPGGMEIVNASDVQQGLMSIEEVMRKLEHGPSEPRAASSIPARLFVGGLAHEVTEDDLREAFGVFGPVADCIVMVERETRTPRGFGFVTMESRKDAPRAIAALDGSELKGRKIAVNVATERQR